MLLIVIRHVLENMYGGGWREKAIFVLKSVKISQEVGVVRLTTTTFWLNSSKHLLHTATRTSHANNNNEVMHFDISLDLVLYWFYPSRHKSRCLQRCVLMFNYSKLSRIKTNINVIVHSKDLEEACREIARTNLKHEYFPIYIFLSYARYIAS